MGGHAYIGVSVYVKNCGNVALSIGPERKASSPSVVMSEEFDPYLSNVQEPQDKSPEYKLELLG